MAVDFLETFRLPKGKRARFASDGAGAIPATLKYCIIVPSTSTPVKIVDYIHAY